jgi:hypothetical protein
MLGLMYRNDAVADGRDNNKYFRYIEGTGHGRQHDWGSNRGADYRRRGRNLLLGDR